MTVPPSDPGGTTGGHDDLWGAGGPAGFPPQFPGSQPPTPAQQVAPATCAWHPDRATGLQCSRCGRSACPECLTPASVGFHCRQCVADARGSAPARAARTFSGSRLGERPLVSYVLVAVNVVVFVVTAVQARSVEEMSPSELFNDGLLMPGPIADGEWWRVVTAGFLHLGIIHLVMNMLSLVLIGPTLEQFLGRVRFLVVYLISLLGGSVLVLVTTQPIAATAGASGAIFGVMGALVIAFKRARLDLRQLIVVLAINLFITFQFSGISWQGHLGGLIAGGLAGAVMVYSPHRSRTAWQVGGCAAILVVLAAVVALRIGSIPPWSCYQQGIDYYCMPLR